jgi:hypothetical protein
MLLNRKYEYRKCGHVVGTKSARECIKAIIGVKRVTWPSQSSAVWFWAALSIGVSSPFHTGTNNKFKLFVATQDADLRADLRLIPCMSIMTPGPEKYLVVGEAARAWGVSFINRLFTG